MFSDFLTRENIIFFSIYGIIFLAVVITFFVILFIILRGIINLLKKLFKKRNFSNNGEDLEPVVKELEESRAERAKLGEQESELPHQKLGVNEAFIMSEKKATEKKEVKVPGADNGDAIKGQPTTPQQGLDALKSKGEGGQETLSSKMPSREEKDSGQQREIKIPVAKRFEAQKEESVVNRGTNGLPDSKEAAKAAVGPAFQQNAGEIKIPVAKGTEAINHKESQASGPRIPTLNKEDKEAQSKNFFGKLFDDKKSLFGKKHESEGKKKDDSLLFGNKEEVSRMNLRQKLKSAKMYTAEKSVGLSLTPIERAKLEKQIFSPVLGYNISKTDLKWSIKKLNAKMLTSKNPAEKGKIRKEIKFFKKIGGIK